MQTADDRFVAVQDQEQWHISTVETVIASQSYNSKYFPRNVHDNHNSSSNTQVAAPPSALRRLITPTGIMSAHQMYNSSVKNTQKLHFAISLSPSKNLVVHLTH